jgi:hypothetical protein
VFEEIMVKISEDIMQNDGHQGANEPRDLERERGYIQIALVDRISWP